MATRDEATGNDQRSVLIGIVLQGTAGTAEVIEALAALGFADPRRADSLLDSLLSDTASAAVFAPLGPTVLAAVTACPAPDMTLTSFERFVSAQGSRVFLYRLLSDTPRLLGALIDLFSTSQFLSDTLIRNPEYLNLVAELDLLEQPRSGEELETELRHLVAATHSYDAVKGVLRRFTRRELFRIACRDILKLGRLRAIVREISHLATAVVRVAVAAAKPYVTAPQEFTTAAEAPVELMTIACGKLGGEELNYSSDIDLIFVFETTPPLAEPKAPPLEVAEKFATRWAQGVIDLLSSPTPDGFCYRVDMRLRPEGSRGRLASSFAAFLAYYESWSEPWERQALIKAHALTGSETLQQRFERFRTGFVFSRRATDNEVREIRDVKRRTEERVARNGQRNVNVKEGRGAIRDIEFTVQVLQLLAGSEYADVQARGTMEAAAALHERRMLRTDEYEDMMAAYAFFRILEHRLQIMNERPLRVLPGDPDALDQLARRMGFGGAGGGARDELLRIYDQHTSRVRQICEDIFFGLTAVDMTPLQIHVADLIDAADAPDSAPDWLAELGFADPAAAAQNLRAMVIGQSDVRLPVEDRRLFIGLSPNIVDAVTAAPDPDAALMNLQRFAQATGNRVDFLAALAAKPESLRLLAGLAGTSQYLSDTLQRNPQYIDLMLGPHALTASRSVDEFQEELAERVAERRDYRSKLNELRRFKRREMLRIGIRDVAGDADVVETTGAISDLAIASLRVALEFVREEVGRHHRDPGAAFSAIGMGKLGARELHYSSDLDLMFVFDAAKITTATREFCERLAQELIRALSQMTEEGYDFKIDARLRPLGGKGTVANSLAACREYYTAMAELWERQALIRARWVAGDAVLGAAFETMAAKFAFPPQLTPDDLCKIRDMKRLIEAERFGKTPDALNVKLCPGGILDVEFTCQLLQMQHGFRHPEVRSAHTLAALKSLTAAGVMDERDGRELAGDYLFLRRIEDRLQIAEEHSQSVIVLTNPHRLHSIARRCGFPDASAFLDELHSRTGSCRAIHERLFFGATP